MQLAKPKLSYLSMAIMLSLGATNNVLAAEEQADAMDESVETITVTGIRGSLVRAMDLKKSADGIVDAISAEDIGNVSRSERGRISATYFRRFYRSRWR